MNQTLCTRLLAIPVLTLIGATPASALEYQVGDVAVDVILAAAAQAAAFQDGPDGERDSDASLLAFGRLNLEWISGTGRVYGVRAEVDDGTRRSEDLAADELYAYFASELGRFELGRQDGAADVMSFHAPVVALGQVRGDFSLYAGINASLSATDTRDSPKLVYLSPPVRGLRFGVSYAPEFTVNENAEDPRRRIRQDNAIEAAVQYVRPLAEDWSLGASVALVRGDAAPETERRDLSAWGAGLELRRDELVIGAAYVDNGDSNAAAPLDEREWNAGIGWLAARWGAAFSWARNESVPGDLSLLSVGGFYSVTDYLVLRADAVLIDEHLRSGVRDRYPVVLFEVGIEL